MAYTTINKSTEHFNTKLYSGNGSTNAITGVGFQPDWVWFKNRDISTDAPTTYDAVRGATKRLQTSTSGAESTKTNGLTAFNSDGYTAGSASAINANGSNIVAWNWKAGTTGSGNTTGSGTYKAYSYSVNTTAGFSIVKYKGNGTAGHTIPHHLGAVPKMYVVKKISGTGDWYTYHVDTGATTFLKLNGSDAKLTNSLWNNTAPTSSVFNIDNNSAVNGNDEDYIAYCFAEKTGYSKFGSYTGNGNANGTFVYTGFKPSFYMVKQANVSGEGWFMWDNKRSSAGGANENDRYLIANSTATEGTLGVDCDFLSNGVKTRYGASATNTSGSTYIYMAFGQSLVGSNNIPCTAR